MNQIEQHVGELLSGYLDGELTQQQRQLVSLHCEQCEECQGNLQELQALRRRIGKAELSLTGTDQWRETMQDQKVQTSYHIGWVLLLVPLALFATFGAVAFLMSTESVWLKLGVVAIYAGLGLLLYSVFTQRRKESKTDKYKDVEI